MRFDLVSVISSGCKSEVHKCIDRGEKHLHEVGTKMVAIKVIRNKERAYEEINNLLFVGHHNIIPIIDIIEDSHSVRIVMPFLKMDLRSFMGCIVYNTDVMLQIKLQTMAAVHHIHTRGILHMDIKPENICIDFIPPGTESEDMVYCLLVDFGSSVVTEEMRRMMCGSVKTPSTIQSTRGYISPELAEHGILSSACDIYSLGVVFNELIDNRRQSFAESVETSTSFLQLSIDMRNKNFRSRPSSKEILQRLGDVQVCKSLTPLLQNTLSSPGWTSPIASMLMLQCGRQKQSVAGALIDDPLSTNLQKLVTLVCSSDVGHIKDAFWLLFESSVEEADKKCSVGGSSVLSVLHYFDSRIDIARENSLFYAKSLDILSLLPYFILSDDMKLHLWKVSSTSHSCERPIIRCLANSLDPSLAAWCVDDRKLWGVRQEEFGVFIRRFVGDWDKECAKAAQIIANEIS